MHHDDAVAKRFGPREAQRARRALHDLTNHLGCVAEPGRLAAMDPGRVADAWTTLQGQQTWGPRHRARMLAAVCHALATVAPAVVPVLNPRARAPARTVVLESQRSWLRQFPLHECLPLRVRRASPLSLPYRVLHELLWRLSHHLRSVSRQNLRTAGNLLDRLIADVDPPLLTTVVGGRDEALQALRGLTAAQWLQRYGRLYDDQQRLSACHFHRHIRYISLLHHQVLGNPGRIPAVTGVLHQRITTTTSSSGSSSSSSSSTPEDPHHVRQLLNALRVRLCRPFDPLEETRRVYAFTIRETRTILEAAITSLERLVITLFLSTGLRIGGLSRLQWRESVSVESLRHGRTVPGTMVTIEKGCKVREVRLLPVVRMLIARLYQDNGPRSATTAAHLFPGRRGGAAGSRYIWTICRTVFGRSGIRGEHVHPHTFRHTVIQCLYMRGRTFDQIAKWIGHTNSQVTSGVYGRLRFHDTQRLMEDDGNLAAERARWNELFDTGRAPVPRCQYIKMPYRFEAWETEGLLATAAPATTTSGGTLQQVLHQLSSIQERINDLARQP